MNTYHISSPRATSTTPAHLAEVLARLEAADPSTHSLTDRKSAVRQVAVVLRRSLAEIPADPAELRHLMHRAPYAASGMTKARWSRVRTHTMGALRFCGVQVMPGRDIAGLNSAWTRLFERLDGKRRRAAMSRFMSFCSRAGIAPRSVTAETFESFKQTLEAQSLLKKPREVYTATIYRWNEAAEGIEGWSQLLIDKEPNARHYSLQWDEFMPEFVADLEAFLADAGSQDVLDDDYDKSIRPGTVLLRRRLVRQMASALIAHGVARADLISLAMLVEPENAKAILRWQMKRCGGAGTPSIVQQAWLLCTIAKRWVKNDAYAAEARGFASRLAGKPTGMKPRNRQRLRQFDHPDNVQALLHLPAKLVARAKKQKRGDRDEAREVMVALAIELLIVAPMRIGNLAALERERHVLEFGRGRTWQRHIVIPGEETKTNAPFEMQLPANANALMDLYLETYRPRIGPSDSIYLFPNSNGEMRNVIGFSRIITKTVERETGIQMHAHLFRHLAAKLHLDSNPGDIETARRFLGHATSTTTLAHYAEQRTDQAFKRLGDTILSHRSNRKPS